MPVLPDTDIALGRRAATDRGIGTGHVDAIAGIGRGREAGGIQADPVALHRDARAGTCAAAGRRYARTAVPVDDEAAQRHARAAQRQAIDRSGEIRAVEFDDRIGTPTRLGLAHRRPSPKSR
jgi:hypothetical protein